MPKQIITRSVRAGGIEVRKDVEISSGAERNLDESIPAGASNFPLDFSAYVGLLKSLFMVADQDVTVKTNSSGDPDNTFVIPVNRPFQWITGDPDLRDTNGTALSNITTIFVTNGSEEEAARFQLFSVSDPFLD